MYECLSVVRFTTERGLILRRQKANGAKIRPGGEKSLIEVHRKKGQIDEFEGGLNDLNCD
jgi:hypothetical protein